MSLQESAEIMSKKKEIICIGVSYSAPYFYLAAYSFHTFDECLFLNKTLSLDTKKYSSAIWVSSLPYALFDIHELTTIESSQSLKQKQQIQYMGLKMGFIFGSVVKLIKRFFKSSSMCLIMQKRQCMCLNSIY